MSDTKYQVFISSTYEDLKEERRAVEQTIIRAGDFPVGMEAFPAADEEQFSFIKSIIKQCDYYVLIISGRYGSLALDGKSYTQKEYEYAKEIGVPVLLMVREKREELPANKTEAIPENKKKLEQFIQDASTGRIRKGWETIDGLKLAVREALDHAKATKPRPGWVRGGHSTSAENLQMIISLREENDALKKKLEDTTPKILLPKNLAGLETKIKISGSHMVRTRSSRIRENFFFTISLGDVFSMIAPHLILPKIDSSVEKIIAALVVDREYPDENSSAASIDDGVFQKIKIQLSALNLITIGAGETSGGGVGLFWELTGLGKQEMFSRIAIVNKE